MPPPTKQRPKTWQRIVQVVILIAVVFGIYQATKHALAELRTQQTALKQKIESLDKDLANSTDPNASQALRQQITQLRRQSEQFWEVRWNYLLLAGLVYTAGSVLTGIYWFGTLRHFGQKVPFLPMLRAYFLGHLAKYVPGKAMVLVVRVGLMRRFGAALAPTTVAVFMETLNSLAIAGTLAGGALLQWSQSPQMILLAVLGSVCSLLPTFPPLFNLVLKFLLKTRLSTLEQAETVRMDWSHFVFGWVVLLPAWILVGTSLAMVIMALPAAPIDQISSLHLIAVCVSVVSVAAIAGFVSFLPGGAGVRELVVMVLLEPMVGGPVALAAAVWHRLLCISSELITTTCLLPLSGKTAAESAENRSSDGQIRL